MLNFSAMLAQASQTASEVAQGVSSAAQEVRPPSFWEALASMWFIPVFLAAMYFFLIRPQKKRQKQEAEMRSNVQIGDDITTIGGIVGKIVNLREDSVVIETGADRTKLRIKRWAIQSVDTIRDTNA